MYHLRPPTCPSFPTSTAVRLAMIQSGPPDLYSAGSPVISPLVKYVNFRGIDHHADLITPTFKPGFPMAEFNGSRTVAWRTCAVCVMIGDTHGLTSIGAPFLAQMQ